MVQSEKYEGPERRDGNGRVIWWIMGVIGALVVAGASAWAQNTTRQIWSINDELSKRTGLISSNTTGIGILSSRLERIENKIDRLIERGVRT